MRNHFWARAGLVAWVCGCFAVGAVVTGQVTVPYTFTDGTRAVASEVNSNFSTLGTQALNRTGGTMTGHLLFTDATYDIGASGATRPRDYFGSRDLTIGRNASIGGTLGVTGATTLGVTTFTANSSLTKSGGATFSVTSTSLDGAGGYASAYFGNASNGAAIGHNNAGQFVINIANGGDVVTNTAFDAFVLDSDTGAVALPMRGLHVGGASDAGDNNLLVDGTTSINALAVPGVITPSALTAVANTNDWTLTGLSTATFVRASPSVSGMANLTGIAGGTAGKVVLFCHIGTVTYDIAIYNQHASSSAANRFSCGNDADVNTQCDTMSPGACRLLIYDGTSSRWRILGF